MEDEIILTPHEKIAILVSILIDKGIIKQSEFYDKIKEIKGKRK